MMKMRRENHGRQLRLPLTKSSWKNLYLALFRSESIAHGIITRQTASNLHCFVIHPHNWWYLAWKFFIVINAAYSSFFTALEFGFYRGLPEKLFVLDIANQIAFLVRYSCSFFCCIS
ncbi:hypothetical protein Patl1_19538 [Pistacia atlantica]|uniref:Uncharacterized protein n=1 Tax=Pistacia atlantica TaxID=434234 RepID=A0ACC1C1N3_9ROSI|nr:hypothetical protein Patl1_19538 [Pistacia atlantica]